ncbi:MAG: NAD(P)H-hydrate dehydratase [Thermoleophilia bacterium]|nr:NAD(P)H-hydrate dehydratase [Thermoleophilia bacterium]
MASWLDPVYDARGMGAADRWAIDEGGIASLDLMEAAGRALAESTAEVAGPGPIRVVCGKGNNGGDGLVAARHLVEAGYSAEVLLLYVVDELSTDAFANYRRLIGVEIFEGSETLSRLDGSGTIIDAVLGTGFEGEPRDPAGTAIKAINAAGATVVSCDIPSGVNASTGEAGLAVRADHTVTFHALKIGHLIAPGKHLCGAVQVVDIGIPRGAPAGDAAGRINSTVLGLPPRRGVASNKFSSGRVSVVGGSKGLTGAVCLAAEGSIRAGAGYATVAVPADLESIFEVKLTEVMSLGCGSTKGHLGSDAKDEILEHCAGAAATVLGSGMGRRKDTGKLIRSLAAKIAGPLVIDADGLGGLDGKLASIKGRKGTTVLTPHTGEMGKLLGLTSSEVDAFRLQSARDLAVATNAVVVLKGDDTIVTDGERVAINDLPAPGLATAGTGDVLAGVVAAMLARELEPFAAACAAVYAHTVAGRIAADQVGSNEGVIAFDVIEVLPQALRAAAPDDRALE